jgi:hypothetical protein
MKAEADVFAPEVIMAHLHCAGVTLDMSSKPGLGVPQTGSVISLKTNFEKYPQGGLNSPTIILEKCRFSKRAAQNQAHFPPILSKWTLICNA